MLAAPAALPLTWPQRQQPCTERQQMIWAPLAGIEGGLLPLVCVDRGRPLRTPAYPGRLTPAGSLFALVEQRGTHTDHGPCTAERAPRPRFQCGTPSFSEPLVSNVPRASAPTARLPPPRVDAHPRAPSSASCGSACSLEQWAFCLESAWQGRVHFRVVQPPPPVLCATRPCAPAARRTRLYPSEITGKQSATATGVATVAAWCLAGVPCGRKGDVAAPDSPWRAVEACRAGV